MPLHHKVEVELTPAELDELGKWIRDANGTRTTDEVHEWVQAKGYTIGRTAVANWLLKFRQEMQAERMSGSGALAKAMLTQARESDGAKAVTDATLLAITQRIFETLSSGEEVTANDLNMMALTMQRTTLAAKRAEEREKLVVVEATKVVEAGGDGRAVVDKVREVLGIK